MGWVAVIVAVPAVNAVVMSPFGCTVEVSVCRVDVWSADLFSFGLTSKNTIAASATASTISNITSFLRDRGGVPPLEPDAAHKVVDHVGLALLEGQVGA